MQELRAWVKKVGGQKKAAAIIGTPQSHLCNILKGKRVPSLPLAIHICRVSGAPIESLVPEARQYQVVEQEAA
jgi:DNA-binding XRE family transcriptional regulator